MIPSHCFYLIALLPLSYTVVSFRSGFRPLRAALLYLYNISLDIFSQDLIYFILIANYTHFRMSFWLDTWNNISFLPQLFRQSINKKKEALIVSLLLFYSDIFYRQTFSPHTDPVAKFALLISHIRHTSQRTILHLLDTLLPYFPLSPAATCYHYLHSISRRILPF